jgi:phosphate transport system substrate-binding protein
VNINRRLVGVAFIAGLLVVACAGDGATSAPTTGVAPPTTGAASPGAVPTGISGNVDIHGSSTVAPISNAVAEDLQAANPNFSYFVGEEGTGDGFELFFCVGQADISDASRAIRAADPATEEQEEAELCEANGVDYVELKVAYDGLAVITSINNPIECLTFADIYALMGPESDAVANWNDAETLAHELGSTTDLPDAQLSITAPGDESGTYDSFVELALGDIIEAQFPDDPDANMRLRTPGDIYVASANDNAVIQGVGGFPTSLGFVGLAYAEENTDSVKILGVDAEGDGNCVVPSIETVSDGSYPISRPLFIYPNLGSAADNPAIGRYVDFYLSDAGIANAAEVGYVALPAEELAATRQAWDAAKP